MEKIIFSISLVLMLLLAVPIYVFAENDNMKAIGNSIKNMVSDSEKSIEDGARNITTKSKDATNAMGDMTGKAGDAIKSAAETTAQKTAVETDKAANNLMNPTTWAWIVIGMVVVAIVAIFWYFIVQSRK